MCVIVDASVGDEVFGSSRSTAGKQFFEWLNDGKGILVIGGKLRKEFYDKSHTFSIWAQQAQNAGIIRNVNDAKVDDKTRQILADGNCKSNDQHIIALAQLGGARLLYSNDKDLHQDFGNRTLIDKPRGKVYSTKVHKDLTPDHQRLLRLKKRHLCGVPE